MTTEVNAQCQLPDFKFWDNIKNRKINKFSQDNEFPHIGEDFFSPIKYSYTHYRLIRYVKKVKTCPTYHFN